jgi:hypothetical protein
LSVWVEEQEENHAEGHEVHVDQEQDAAVIEAPPSLHATDGVDGADEGNESGEDEERSGVDFGEAGEQDCRDEAGQDEETAAYEGTRTWIEKARAHAILNTS